MDNTISIETWFGQKYSGTDPISVRHFVFLIASLGGAVYHDAGLESLTISFPLKDLPITVGRIQKKGKAVLSIWRLQKDAPGAFKPYEFFLILDKFTDLGFNLSTLPNILETGNLSEREPSFDLPSLDKKDQWVSLGKLFGEIFQVLRTG